MKKKNYLKVRFNLWTKSFHFKRFQTIMIIVGIIVLYECLVGHNYMSLMAIPCASLLFGGFTLFPNLFPVHDGEDLDRTLEDKIKQQKQQDYEDYLKSPEGIRMQREKKLNRVYGDK